MARYRVLAGYSPGVRFVFVPSPLQHGQQSGHAVSDTSCKSSYPVVWMHGKKAAAVTRNFEKDLRTEGKYVGSADGGQGCKTHALRVAHVKCANVGIPARSLESGARICTLYAPGREKWDMGYKKRANE